MVIDEVEIVEVSPRDGLQNEKTLVKTADKVRLIERAISAGVRRIEVASFVNPRRVPQMADAEDVCAAIGKCEGVTTIGLVLNRRGAERALRTPVDELGAVVSASDGFGIANQARNSDETVDEAIDVIRLAHASGRSAQVVVSVAFGCPFDGEIDPQRVASIVRKLASAHPREIALGDTIGAATPAQVRHLLRLVRAEVPGVPIRCHFHDTRNMAIANCLAALDCGVAVLDGSIGGLGGCPFAPGATGNVATEDLIYMLNGADIRSGVSLDALINTARWINPLVGARLSKLAQIGAFPGAR